MSSTTPTIAKTGRAPTPSTLRAHAARLISVSMAALADVASDKAAAPADRVSAVRLLRDLATDKSASKEGHADE